MDDPTAIVSPGMTPNILQPNSSHQGGVGFDINCGVRLLRTNLMLKDVEPVKEQLAQALFDHIPVGVGSQGLYFEPILSAYHYRGDSNCTKRFRRSFSTSSNLSNFQLRIKSRKWVWIGLYVKAMLGQKIKNTVKNTGECLT